MPPSSVRGFSWFGAPATGVRDDAPAVRLTVLLHAAPLSSRRTTLRVSDSLMLVGLLSSLLERMPTRSVRLVVFNLDQQKELFRQENFSPKALIRWRRRSTEYNSAWWTTASCKTAGGTLTCSPT